MTATPGPWVAQTRATGGYNIIAVDDVLEDVVVGMAVLGDHSLETAHANAQMLAAGPKLVTCIKMLLDCAEIAADMMEIIGAEEKPKIEAAIAHELGHVWIFSHHPYLQTEQLANRIAMRAVSRDSLQRVYAKLWERGGMKGDLTQFLGN